jgi:hypothetical protein
LQGEEEAIMHHPILWGLLAAFVVTRIIFRARMRRAYGYGGGCGRFARFGHGPIILGGLDAPAGHAHFGRWARRWHRWHGARPQDRQGSDTRVPVDVRGALELNARQQELFDDVVGKAKAAVDVGALAEALAAVGREPFDRAMVEAIVHKVELVDDFEQLHHSLTPEQRAQLRDVTAA